MDMLAKTMKMIEKIVHLLSETYYAGKMFRKKKKLQNANQLAVIQQQGTSNNLVKS